MLVPVDDLEELVKACVALTARLLAQVAPELTFLQWRTLVILDAPEDRSGTPVGRLAAELGASVSATSRIVRRLESRGLVDVARSDVDRRVRLVRVSALGRPLHDEVVARRRAVLSRLAGAGEPGDAAVIRRIATALNRREPAIRP